MLSIKTRSKNIDYIDYGNTPYTNWEKDWGIKGIGADPMGDPPEGVSAADICLLVDNGQWKGAVYWLYGTRTDMMGRRKIRYGILGSGQVGDEDFKLFRKLCAYVLVSRTEQDYLAKLLDSHFTDEVVEELLNNQRDSKEKAYQKVQNILRQVVEQLPEGVGTGQSSSFPVTDMDTLLRCEMVTSDNTRKFCGSLQLLADYKECDHPILLFHGSHAKVNASDVCGKVSGFLVSDHWEGSRPREPIPVELKTEKSLPLDDPQPELKGMESEESPVIGNNFSNDKFIEMRKDVFDIVKDVIDNMWKKYQ